jgi:hypothetical protein
MLQSRRTEVVSGIEVELKCRGAWLALAYLNVAGSIVAFTAYVWLLHHESHEYGHNELHAPNQCVRKEI